MKAENKKLDKELLNRLQNHGILLSSRAPALSREKALVLIGEAMLDKIVKEINEFVSLWRELFPNCRLQDFEASEEEKKKILGRQDNNDLCIREMQTEAGIEYWDIIMPRRKTAKADRRSSDLWRNSSVLYQPGKKKTSNYEYQNRRQLLPGYARHYQFPKQLKSYTYGRIRLPTLYKSFGKPAKSTRNLSPIAKMPQLYQRQIGSKSFELGAGSNGGLLSSISPSPLLSCSLQGRVVLTLPPYCPWLISAWSLWYKMRGYLSKHRFVNFWQFPNRFCS